MPHAVGNLVPTNPHFSAQLYLSEVPLHQMLNLGPHLLSRKTLKRERGKTEVRELARAGG